jgi:hypothetical protein
VIRRALRRPLLTSVAALAATTLVAGGYALGAAPAPAFSAADTAQTESTLVAGVQEAPVPKAAAARRVVDTQAADHRATLAAQAARAAAAAVADRARAAEAARVSRSRERARLLSDPRSAAQLLLADHGWSSSQYSCLDSLWTKESGWDYQAQNASSGAYGIPQALPGAKMGTVGSDWRTNPLTQIRWGLQYIADSYGTPCSAWAHSQSTGWY